jgi:hypothetical protein
MESSSIHSDGCAGRRVPASAWLTGGKGVHVRRIQHVLYKISSTNLLPILSKLSTTPPRHRGSLAPVPLINNKLRDEQLEFNHVRVLYYWLHLIQLVQFPASTSAH